MNSTPLSMSFELKATFRASLSSLATTSRAFRRLQAASAAASCGAALDLDKFFGELPIPAVQEVEHGLALRFEAKTALSLPVSRDAKVRNPFAAVPRHIFLLVKDTYAGTVFLQETGCRPKLCSQRRRLVTVRKDGCLPGCYCGYGAGPGLQPVAGHVTTAVRPAPRRPHGAVEAVVNGVQERR
jgi:hypothetical protein